MKSRIESFFENVRLEMEQAGRKPMTDCYRCFEVFPREYARIAVRLGLIDLEKPRERALISERSETEGLSLAGI